MPHLLEVNNLQTYFYTAEGVVKAVDGVSFTLDERETLGIVGESGSGKSVTAMSIMKLIASPPGKVVGGEILYRGENLLNYSREDMRHIRGKEISMIFQDPMTSLNPVLKVSTQIGESLQLHMG
ncbi:MAG TPA: ATP-binding cassette domain-containing protein, partial [Chloroflexia bacterium]